MKINEFVNEYNKVVNSMKNKYISDNIEIKKYVDLSDKINIVSRIVNSTSYEKDIDGNDTGNVHINSIARYLLFTLVIVDTYTNLDVDFDNMFSEYDALKSSGVLELLIGSEHQLIPVDEYFEFQTLLNMRLDDIVQNEFTTQSFIKNQVTRFGTLIGVSLSPIMDKLADTLNNMDESSIEKLGVQFDKILKRLTK